MVPFCPGGNLSLDVEADATLARNTLGGGGKPAVRYEHSEISPNVIDKAGERLDFRDVDLPAIVLGVNDCRRGPYDVPREPSRNQRVHLAFNTAASTSQPDVVPNDRVIASESLRPSRNPGLIIAPRAEAAHVARVCLLRGATS
jgi:hypothetical protein